MYLKRHFLCLEFQADSYMWVRQKSAITICVISFNDISPFLCERIDFFFLNVFETQTYFCKIIIF